MLRTHPRGVRARGPPALGLEVDGEFSRTEGMREQESLHPIAAEAAQGGQLLLSLDTLCDHGEIECVSKVDDRAGDSRAATIFADSLHKGSVDLDVVQRECLQVGEGGEACTEVVEPD